MQADVLADRIAIIADGRLVCDGSSMFLKQHFGVGYTLSIAKDEGCDSKKVAAIVRASVEGAKITSDIGTELQIKMPREETEHFPVALAALEAQKDDIKISSMGISVTTMEEVFLKAALVETADQSAIDESARRPLGESRVDIVVVDDERAPSPSKSYIEAMAPAPLAAPTPLSERAVASFGKQLSTMARKNVTIMLRSPAFTVCMVLVPLAFMVFGASYRPPETGFNPLNDAPSRDLFTTGTVLLETSGSTDCTTGLCTFARETYFPSQTLATTSFPSIRNYILGLKFTDTSEFNEVFQIGLKFDEANDTILGMFNGQYYHTAAVTLRAASALILANATGTSFDDLHVANYPLSKTARQTANAGKALNSAATLWSEMNAFALVIFTSLLVFRPIKERASSAKLMQLVSGASHKSYWASYFVVDFAVAVPFAFIPLIALCTGPSPMIEPDFAGALLLLNTLFFTAVSLRLFWWTRLLVVCSSMCWVFHC